MGSSHRHSATLLLLGPALLLTFGLLPSCTALFDYGDDASGKGGSGGSTACASASDCDDGDDCSDDSCVNGSCQHATSADGQACTVATSAGICEAGSCVVACSGSDPSECDDDEPCTDDACDAVSQRCTHAPVPDGPVTDPVAGDCGTVLCLDGTTTTEVDDADVPVDGNPCTDDVCTQGTPSNPPVAAGTSCGGDLVCDDAGICVGCNLPADCPGTNDFCQTVTCDAQQCGVSYTADGTALPAGDQTAGACKEIQCDGAGGTKTVNRANGTSCDDGQFCNGSDSCSGGSCGHSGDPCPGADGDSDCSETCNESSDSCTSNDANGSSCNDGLYCNGSDTCSSGSCSSHAGNPCPGADGDSDCTESCNESSDNCTASDPNGSSCSDGLYCNGSDTCSGGSCSGHAGNPCPGPDGDSDCSETCNESTNSCTANDPIYSPCPGYPNWCCISGSCQNGPCAL